MLKARATLIRKITILIDISLLLAAFLLAMRLTNALFDYQHSVRAIFLKNQWAIVLSVPIFAFIFYFNGLYESIRTSSTRSLIWVIGKSILEGLLILSLGIWFFRLEVSRTLFFLFSTFSFIILVSDRLAAKQILSYWRKKGYNFRTLLIVGADGQTRQIIEQFQRNLDWGYKIAGCLALEPDRLGREINGVKVLGTTERFQEILWTQPIDEVIFSIPIIYVKELSRLIGICEELGIKSRTMIDFYTPKVARPTIERFGDSPMLTFSTTPENLNRLLIKRIIDVLASSIALVLALPLFALIGQLINATSHGPIFYSQDRCGLNGRIFKFYKFRTMVQDADKIQERFKHLNEMSGPVFKIKNDPRVTRIGRFLRKYSLDELPQLYHVLTGDMSLVGPRPPVPPEVNQYERWQRRRLSVRPGITCLWQCNGRNKVDFDQWMKLDLEYIDNWSLALDFKILLKTIPVVLIGEGAS